jgi:hypothetical protein
LETLTSAGASPARPLPPFCSGTRSVGIDFEPILVAFTGAAVAVLVWLGARSWRQAATIAALVVPLAILGFGLALTPDLLEQVLITGSF